MAEAKVIFNFEGIDITIQCSQNELMKDICQKYVNEIDKNINSLIFLYRGNQLNFNSNFNQQINIIDKERNVMKILVYKNEDSKCINPKCDEKIKLNNENTDDIILYINNIKEKIISTKSSIDNIIKLSSDNLINNKLKDVNLILKTLNEDINKINDKLSYNQRTSKRERLDWKGVLFSIFFGFIIGIFSNNNFIFSLLMKSLHCLVQVQKYIILFVLVIYPLRFLIKIPPFLFRKILHAIGVYSFSLMLLYTDDWRGAALASLIILALNYSIFCIIEKASWYKNMLVEKSEGEVKCSMIKIFLMYSTVIVIAWGIFQKPLAATSAILMWGFGDATAAIVGIPFGRHKIHLPGAIQEKSWEGTFSMLVVSFVIGLCLLYFSGGLPVVRAMAASLLMAVAGSITEMYTTSEWDTVTVPLVILLFGIFLL